jgi:hypothetical protein
MAKLKLGEFLVQEGLIDSYQLDVALENQKRWGKKLGRCLVELNFLKEKALYETLSKSLQIPIIDLTRIKSTAISRQVTQLVPLVLAKTHRVVPLMIREVRGKKRLIVATSDPLNYEGLNEVRFHASQSLFVMIAPDDDIDWFIGRYYARSGSSKGYVSVVELKKIGQSAKQFEVVDSVFEDSLFASNTKTLKTRPKP